MSECVYTTGIGNLHADNRYAQGRLSFFYFYWGTTGSICPWPLLPVAKWTKTASKADANPKAPATVVHTVLLAHLVSTVVNYSLFGFDYALKPIGSTTEGSEIKNCIDRSSSQLEKTTLERRRLIRLAMIRALVKKRRGNSNWIGQCSVRARMIANVVGHKRKEMVNERKQEGEVIRQKRQTLEILKDLGSTSVAANEVANNLWHEQWLSDISRPPVSLRLATPLTSPSGQHLHLPPRHLSVFCSRRTSARAQARKKVSI